MPKMVCRSPNTYGGKKRQVGDYVEVHRNDIRLVTTLGWFEEPKPAAPPVVAAKASAPAPKTEKPPKAPVESAAPAAAPLPAQAGAPAPPAADVAAPAAKRAYQRRDMTAEGS